MIFSLVIPINRILIKNKQCTAMTGRDPRWISIVYYLNLFLPTVWNMEDNFKLSKLYKLPNVKLNTIHKLLTYNYQSKKTSIDMFPITNNKVPRFKFIHSIRCHKKEYKKKNALMKLFEIYETSESTSKLNAIIIVNRRKRKI